MALNLATLNSRRLRDRGKCARLLSELLNHSANVGAVQETHFNCTADCWVLEDDYIVLSANGRRRGVVVSLLIECSLNADTNLVLADDGDWLAGCCR